MSSYVSAITESMLTSEVDWDASDDEDYTQEKAFANEERPNDHIC